MHVVQKPNGKPRRTVDFRTTCILDCQLVGVPTGTLSITPSLTSSSSWFFTSSRKWIGTGRALWAATGLASLSMWILSGTDDIIGRRWWLHLLNVDDEYRSSSHSFILSTFSAIGWNGSRSGNGGGGVRDLQPPGHSSAVLPPPLVPAVVETAAATLGKSALMIPSAFMTPLEMKRSLTPSATLICAAVSMVLPVTGSRPAKRRTTTPRTLRLLPLMEVDWLLILHKSDFFSPSL